MSETLRPPRSYKRLIKTIAKANERREHLLQEQKLSLPSGSGILAIIVSRVPDHRSHLTRDEQHRAFLAEAERLRQERALQHQEVLIRPIAVDREVAMDFGDPDITDIILIGHGSISSMWTDGGGNFDWRSAAKSAKYLKQGKIEQRMCGNLPSAKVRAGERIVEALPHNYSVPLGTFTVSQLSNVIAAPGMKVPDVHPPDELFQPIYAGNADAVTQIAVFNDTYRNLPTTVVDCIQPRPR